MSEDGHITAGRMDADLLVWAITQIENAEAEGVTMIAMAHHGFIPHFSMAAELAHEYVIEDWRKVSTALADAGLRYIFTGHMHANDVAEFTTIKGNHLTDVETASLVSYGSPVRQALFTKGSALQDGTARTSEELKLNSSSIQSIQMNEQTIDNLLQYNLDTMYSDQLPFNMAIGQLRPMLKQAVDEGILSLLEEFAPDFDLNAVLSEALTTHLGGGMQMELGSGIGRVTLQYKNQGIQITPYGTAGWFTNPATITDAQIQAMVADLLKQITEKYIQNDAWITAKTRSLVDSLVNQKIYEGSDKNLYDFALSLLTMHYAGGETPEAWVVEALESLSSGWLVERLITTAVTWAKAIANEVAQNVYLKLDYSLSGLMLTAINNKTSNGQLAAFLGMLDMTTDRLIDNTIYTYLTDSFTAGLGTTIQEYASSLAYDETQDDILGASERVISFNGSGTTQTPTVANGLLPTQISMSMGTGEGVYSKRNYSWYTGTHVSSGEVQILPYTSASPDFNSDRVHVFKAESETVKKAATRMNLALINSFGSPTLTRHLAEVTGLSPNSNYWYRVGSSESNTWSQAVRFRTGPAEGGFGFTVVADSQGMSTVDYQVYQTALQDAVSRFGESAFTVHLGDIVDHGMDETQWTLATAHEAVMGQAFVPVTGNHEYKGDTKDVTEPNALLRHYKLSGLNVPEQDLSTGVYYSFDYQNVCFVVLNTESLNAAGGIDQAQLNWAYQTLNESSAKWKIIALHKSVYSSGPHRQDRDVIQIRAQLNALAADSSVDLVLGGHDHTYNRTAVLRRGVVQETKTLNDSHGGLTYPVLTNPEGTVFITPGTIGVKYYPVSDDASIPTVRSSQPQRPIYAHVELNEERLYYKAYTVQGGSSTLYDHFAIQKIEIEEELAWQKVIEQIAALPSQIQLSDETRINEARVAYDALSTDDKKQVTNYTLLTAAEKTLATLKNIHGKQTVTVSNRDQFVAALNNNNVGTIVVNNTFDVEYISWLQARGTTQNVNRDLTIRGAGTLKYLSLNVLPNVSLILDGSLSIDGSRTSGSIYGAINPIVLNDGATLIMNGSTSLRTEYGTGGSDVGNAIRATAASTRVVLNTSGSIWGASRAVWAGDSTILTINNGTLGNKNNLPTVETNSHVIVNGGTVGNVLTKTFTMTGGTLDNEKARDGKRIPLRVRETAYITGGTIVPYDGKAIQLLEANTRLHIAALRENGFSMGDQRPFIGAITSDNFKNVSASYSPLSGAWSGANGIYESDREANTVEALAALNGKALPSEHQAETRLMKSEIEAGRHIVYGKIYLAGQGASHPLLSAAPGSEAVIYGPTRLLDNNVLTGLEISETSPVIIELGKTKRLSYLSTPANSFGKKINWTSSNEEIATVDMSGMVLAKLPGQVRISVEADENPAVQAEVDVFAINAKIVGEENYVGTNDLSLSLDLGIEDPLFTARWSSSNQRLATIDETNGTLTRLEGSSGSVIVAAEIFYNGESTGIVAEKTIRLISPIQVRVEQSDTGLVVTSG